MTKLDSITALTEFMINDTHTDKPAITMNVISTKIGKIEQLDCIMRYQGRRI